MIRVALCLSGSGSTAEAVVIAAQKRRSIHPVLAIASKPEAKGIGKMKALGVPVSVISPADYKNAEIFGEHMLQAFSKARVDIVSQNGWLPLTPANVIAAYEGRIINQHPGPLDPGRIDFGGKGMFGRRVTAARVAFAWMAGKQFFTEATVHHVTPKFDEGQLIQTKKLLFPKSSVSMSKNEIKKNKKTFIQTVETIAAQLLPLEHLNVIEVLTTYAAKKKFQVVKRKRPLILSSHDADVLREAKKIAIELFPKG